MKKFNNWCNFNRAKRDCKCCYKKYVPGSPNQKYCDKCRSKKAKEIRLHYKESHKHVNQLAGRIAENLWYIPNITSPKSYDSINDMINK